MSINTKGIIRKGTTLPEIKEVLENKYGNVGIKSYSDPTLFSLYFKDGEDQRKLSVFVDDVAKRDYKIDGVTLDLNCWGNSVEIMKLLLSEFGGYLDENDCDDEGFYAINPDKFEEGRESTKADRVITSIIHRLGYDNLSKGLLLFDDIQKIQQDD
jgi:hypothetical protein